MYFEAAGGRWFRVFRMYNIGLYIIGPLIITYFFFYNISLNGIVSTPLTQVVVITQYGQ